jgi:hypothetical protein
MMPPVTGMMVTTPPFAGSMPAPAPVTVYVKPDARVPLSPSGLVTVTFFAPTVPAGTTAVRRVALTYCTAVAATPPTATVAPGAKDVPVIVTLVPPARGPLAGAAPETARGTYSPNWAKLGLRAPPTVEKDPPAYSVSPCIARALTAESTFGFSQGAMPFTVGKAAMYSSGQLPLLNRNSPPAKSMSPPTARASTLPFVPAYQEFAPPVVASSAARCSHSLPPARVKLPPA